MNSNRLALALEEARRIEKQLDEADRDREDQREETLIIHLATLDLPVG